MNISFANRVHGVPRSFIREILKVAGDKDVISFAGGLPYAPLFPVKEIEEATKRVLAKSGPQSLQYSDSEGYVPLREQIAMRYKEKLGIDTPVDQILITTGSQQALDLLGKIFINEGDEVIMEEPGYLGAIQAFSVYQPKFLSVPLHNEGMDIAGLAKTLQTHNPKLMYTVPNFQNPSGTCYSAANREQVSALLKGKDILLIEDDPYGELRFKGEPQPSFKTYLPDQTIMLGTFSKIVVPSFRIGWIVAPKFIMEKLVVMKQAADLHTNFFSQMILHAYFEMFDNKAHIRKVSEAYGKQRDAMVNAIKKYFPTDVQYTQPEGGMFLWTTLPEGISSAELLELAMKKKVVFVPGNQFYTNRTGDVNTLRLNFTCSNEETIDKGIQILGEAIKELIQSKEPGRISFIDNYFSSFSHLSSFV
jgi:2-aminoadipate transaminase